MCDDDSGEGLNPSLRFDAPQSGRYAIWVGTFGGGDASRPAVLRLAHDGALEAEVKRPDVTRPPVHGASELVTNAELHTRELPAGGNVEAATLGIDTCLGFVSHAAAYRVNWNAEGPLSFAVRSDGDTTLLISDPAGQWSCNDGSDGLNPAVTFASPQRGAYSIWVGAFNPDVSLPAVLEVSRDRGQGAP